MSGWRTLTVEKPSRLSVRDNQLSVMDLATGEISRVPMDELAVIVVSTSSGVLTVRLLQELAAARVSVIFCDRRHSPGAELIPFSLHEEAAGCIIDQAAWTRERKDGVWAVIVRQKIENQMRALACCQKPVPPLMGECLAAVQPGDSTNREGLAARAYFPALFGAGFVRHARDSRNAALNYGYAIICSAVSRSLTTHGYHPALGIHHSSRNNRLNLSCDLMEPFRPFVDRLVAEQGSRYFDKLYKRELIAVTQKTCVMDGRRMTMDDALAAWTLQVCKAMADGRELLPEVRLE